MSVFPIPLAVVVPGRPVIKDFVNCEPGLWICEITNPGDISELCVQLLQPITQQPGQQEMGVGVFFSLPSHVGSWEFLGVLTNNRPTDIFSTGWALNPDVARQPSIRIGLHWETRQSLEVKLATRPPVDVKKEIAKKVALNLFHYVESFFTATNVVAEGLGQAQVQRVGQILQDLLDKWFHRFEEKYARDPLFFIRTE